jgi:hypothetical protein
MDQRGKNGTGKKKEKKFPAYGMDVCLLCVVR